MPMYEYECQQCHTHFEQRRPISEADNPLPCTACGSTHVQRMLSLVASYHKTTSDHSLPLRASTPTGGGGCCSGGACGCALN